MNYNKIYNELIESRKLLDRKKNDGNYYEKHHIIPKSLGGEDNKSNLVLLTFKEHWIAHLLLVQIYSGVNKMKMANALWRMCQKGKYQKEKIVSSRQYEKAKKILAENMKGRQSNAKGYKFTEEQIKHISDAHLGEKNYNYGRKFSLEHRRKIGKAMSGEKHPMFGKPAKNRKSVLQIDRNTNKIIKKWDCLEDAQIELKISKAHICDVCRGKRYSTGGYKWRYNDEEFPEYNQKIKRMKIYWSKATNLYHASEAKL